MLVILTVAVVLAVLLAAEFAWRQGWMESELGRKAVHITVGSFVAFWPFFLSWRQIELLSAVFFIAVILSKSLNVFSAIHSVQRPTYGEACFALVVGFLAFVTHDPAVYAAALLQMSLADGLAAILGTKYGRTTRYHVLGHVKSAVGTLTFFVISFGILVAYVALTPVPFSMGLVLVAAGAAALENVAVLGLDNLFVPLFVGAALVLLK